MATFKRLQQHRAAIAVAILTASGVASAAVPTSVTEGISTAVTDVATVGAATLGVYIGIKVFRWLKSAF